MNTYETSATVGEQGRVQVVGVPFLAGTQVEITIRPKQAAREDSAKSASAAHPQGSEDIFAEMQPFMVDVPDVDDSREAIYSPMDGE
jgi:hypothetical protein